MSLRIIEVTAPGIEGSLPVAFDPEATAMPQAVIDQFVEAVRGVLIVYGSVKEAQLAINRIILQPQLLDEDR
jgi:hypothetical protein